MSRPNAKRGGTRRGVNGDKTRSRPREAGDIEPLARLKIKQPSDFIAVVPYLLGFHPHDSVVALFLRQGRVRLSVRIDLPPARPAAAHDMVTLASEVTGLAAHVDAGQVLLLAYGDPVVTRPQMTTLVDHLSLDLLDVLVVGSDRWWSLLCDGSCCPSEGSPYDLGSHPLAAEAVLAGLAVSPSRTDIAAMADGPPEDEIARLEEIAEPVCGQVLELDERGRQRRMAALVREHLGSVSAPSEEDCAWLAALGADVMARDVAWSMMTREQAHDHLDLWRRVVSRTVAPLESAPLCLLAIAAWISGNGALLNCCIDRMEVLDPDYSMLSVCRELSRLAVPPDTWTAIAAEMRRDPRLRAG